MEGPATGKPPRGCQVPGDSSMSAKVEAHIHGKRQHKQARGTERRDERRRLAGDGYSQRPCGW